jgi:CheY-like chemotaxis protein
MSTIAAPLPVLLVEDDADIRNSVTGALSLAGFRVSTATNGSEALERLRAGEAPGLLLVDLMMPVMDGWTFCAELQKDERLRHFPVVLLSAAWHLHSERTNGSGAVGHLSKPLNFAKLFEVVQRFCGPGTIASGKEREGNVSGAVA